MMEKSYTFFIKGVTIILLQAKANNLKKDQKNRLSKKRNQSKDKMESLLLIDSGIIRRLCNFTRLVQ